jgi:hypothetical protein
VVRGEEDLPVVPREHPLLLDGEVSAEIDPEEAQTEPRQSGVRLEVGLDHHRDGGVEADHHRPARLPVEPDGAGPGP